MFRPYHQTQNFLLPRALSEFIPENHRARIISDIVDQMDLSAFYARYSGLGPSAYNPRMMIKVILYGFTEGIFSSRKLARACEEMLPFMYLSGMQTPVYRTFIEFRERHREEMGTVFKETVRVARTMGLAGMGEVAIDGTKVLSDTSKHKAMSYGRMQEEEEKLKGEIDDWIKKACEEDAREEGTPEGPEVLPTPLSEGAARKEAIAQAKEEIAIRKEKLEKIQTAKTELEKREALENPGKEIEKTKQISFADPEARVFSKKSEGTEYVYNAQVAVDMESQIIVGTDLTQTVSDSRAIGGMLEKILETTGELPEMLVADAGYGNVHTLESCEEAGVIPVVATARERKTAAKIENVPVLAGNLAQEGATLAKIEDAPVPAGKTAQKRTTPAKGENVAVLTGFILVETEGSPDALFCPHGIFYIWIYSTLGRRRTYRAVGGGEKCACGCPDDLRVEDATWARFKLRQKQKEHEEVYRRRKSSIEPVFGQIKSGMGFLHFFCRGFEKVKSEWNLVCGAYNLKKMRLRRQLLANGPAPPGADGRKKGEKVPNKPFSCGLFSGAIAANAL